MIPHCAEVFVNGVSLGEAEISVGAVVAPGNLEANGVTVTSTGFGGTVAVDWAPGSVGNMFAAFHSPGFLQRKGKSARKDAKARRARIRKQQKQGRA